MRFQAAISAGASFKNLEFIECIPGKLPGRSERTVLHLFVGQMIWINREGKRFVAEDSRRDVLRESLLSLPERSCFAIVDKKGFDFLDKEHQEAINRGLARNEVYKANSLEELARSMNTPAQATVETVERYNQFVENGKDTDFGKKKPASQDLCPALLCLRTSHESSLLRGWYKNQLPKQRFWIFPELRSQNLCRR